MTLFFLAYLSNRKKIFKYIYPFGNLSSVFSGGRVRWMDG